MTNEELRKSPIFYVESLKQGEWILQTCKTTFDVATNWLHGRMRAVPVMKHRIKFQVQGI